MDALEQSYEDLVRNLELSGGSRSEADRYLDAQGYLVNRLSNYMSCYGIFVGGY